MLGHNARPRQGPRRTNGDRAGPECGLGVDDVRGTEAAHVRPNEPFRQRNPDPWRRASSGPPDSNSSAADRSRHDLRSSSSGNATAGWPQETGSEDFASRRRPRRRERRLARGPSLILEEEALPGTIRCVVPGRKHQDVRLARLNFIWPRPRARPVGPPRSGPSHASLALRQWPLRSAAARCAGRATSGASSQSRRRHRMHKDSSRLSARQYQLDQASRSSPCANLNNSARITARNNGPPE